MIKKIIVVIFALVAVALACSLGVRNTQTMAQQESTTTSNITTTRYLFTTTVKIPRPTVTEPDVAMPNDDTAWANYIVDKDYNYIADRLTDAQKEKVQQMCVTVGCKVSFKDGYTKVTDAKKKDIYYSKSFDEDSLILKPEFGILTLARKADNETTYVYKGATIFDFISYINDVEISGFYYSAVSSTDYVKSEGIFTGTDENGNSVIIKLSDGMVVVALSQSI